MNHQKSLSELIQIWGFEEDLFLFKDGSLGFSLKMTPIDLQAKSDHEINALKLQTIQVLNGLPENTTLQFVQDIRSENSSKLYNYEELIDEKVHDSVRSLSRERVRHFEQLHSNNNLPTYSLKLVVRLNPTAKLFEKKMFKSKDFLHKVTEENLKKAVSQARRTQSNIMQSLKSIFEKVEVMPRAEALALIFDQWNPGYPVEIGLIDPEDIRPFVTMTDLVVNPQGFSLGEYHHRLISLKNLPDQTMAAMTECLTTLPFDSRVFVTVEVLDQQKEIEGLQRMRRVAFSMASGDAGRAQDIESRAKLGDLEMILEDVVSNGEKVFNISFHILLKSKDDEELQDQVAQTLSLVRDMNGSEGMVETLATLPIFSQIAIPHARCKERVKKLKSSNVSDFLPLYGPWSGHRKPSVLLRGRHQNLISFNPFDDSHANGNQLISAGSGAGKSFFCNLFVLQMMKENPRVFFVDIGGSYQRLCENLGGQFIPLGVEGGISINPFDLPSGMTEPSHHKIKFLVGLIELMTKEDEQSYLPRDIKAGIEDAILEVYKTVEKPRLSDLRKILESKSELKRIAKILSSWCGDTAFGNFIDRQTNVELSNQLIAFDLKGLEAYPELQTVCLYLISDQIWSEVQRDRHRMKFVIYDECWKLLKDKAGQEFIESIFRTCRKYFTSCIAISQAIQDFAESSIASAIIPNCSIKWLLIQNQSNTEPLRKHLGLNENEVDLVQSLSQKKGVYSECYLISGTQRRTLAVIEPTPIELWLATTDPKDLRIIDQRKRENPEKSAFEVLRDLAREFPLGA